MNGQDAIIYDKQKFFFLKQLLNSYLNANSFMKPAQKSIDSLMKTATTKTQKLALLQELILNTTDPIAITLVGMNMDIFRIGH